MAVDDFFKIPRELIENNQDLILYIGIMFIKQQSLLTTIDKDTRFRVLVPLANRTK